MKGKKLFLVMVVGLVMVFIVSGLLMGCNKSPSGKLEVEFVSSTEVLLSYTFKNSDGIAVCRDQDCMGTNRTGKGTGTVLYADLESDTDYVFHLKSSDGTPGMLNLDTIKVKTNK